MGRIALVVGLVAVMIAAGLHYRQEAEHQRIGRLMESRVEVANQAIATSNPVRRFIELFPNSFHDPQMTRMHWSARALIKDRFVLRAEFPITEGPADETRFQFGHAVRVVIHEVVAASPSFRSELLHGVSLDDWRRLAEGEMDMSALRLPDDDREALPGVQDAWAQWNDSSYLFSYPDLEPLPN